MRKLVIGCGYLGERVAKSWRDAGHDVAVLTRSAAHANRFRDAGFQAVIGDVTAPDSLRELPPSDTVLYAVGFDRSAGPSMRDIYVDGLRNVLHALNDSVSRFIYISSTSVYGQSQGESIDESSPCEPTQASGTICLEAESLVEEFGHQKTDGEQDCHAVVVRSAGLYGPGRLLRRIESLKNREPIDGNPEAYLNLIHVDDLASAVLAIDDADQPDRLYLACDDRPITRRAYYTQLAKCLDTPPPVFRSDTTGDQSENLGKRCSNRRLREELGLTLRFPTIDEGLPHAIIRAANQP
jgi:nucleoside-diphosphate-sugar epimerase